jgi:hypothetical protein
MLGIGGEQQLPYAIVNAYVWGSGLEVKVMFDERWDDAEGLLGRQGFFAAFQIGFDEAHRRVHYEPLPLPANA